MYKPRPVKKGDPVSADSFNKLLAFVESLVAKSGPGIRINQSPQGTTIGLTQQVQQAVVGGGGKLIHPFQITDASDETSAKVNIRFGLLNNLTPTLDDGTTELGTLTEIALTPPATAGTWVIFMAVAIVDDDSIATPDIDYVYIVAQKDWTEAGDGGDPALLGYQIIAEVDVEAGDDLADPPTFDRVTDIRQNVTHGLKHTLCGRQVADEEADPPVVFSPGLPQFWGV